MPDFRQRFVVLAGEVTGGFGSRLAKLDIKGREVFGIASFDRGVGLGERLVGSLLDLMCEIDNHHGELIGSRVTEIIR